MKNKNGFTIVELIASIVLLLLVSIFAANRIIESDNNSKQKVYNSKIELAKNAAYKYGSDNIDLLGENCKSITIGSLINKHYLKGDSENGLALINPLNNGSMNNESLCIKYIDGEIVVEKTSN